MRNYSIVTEKDFDLYVPSGFSKTAETTTIPDNSYSYSDTLKAAHVNDASASLKGAFSMPIGYAQKGDFITLTAEVMSVSGTIPKLALDLSFTDPVGSGDGNSFIVQAQEVGKFEKVTVKYLCEYDAYYSAVLGVFTGDVGEYFIKNVYVEVDSKFRTEPKKYKPGFRTYVVLGDNGDYTVQSNFSDDIATLTVDSVNKKIDVVHYKPFAKKAGIAFIGLNSSGVSPNYIIRSESESLLGCELRIYDLATNTLQDPATISGLLWFSLFFSGMDNEIELV